MGSATLRGGQWVEWSYSPNQVIWLVLTAPFFGFIVSLGLLNTEHTKAYYTACDKLMAQNPEAARKELEWRRLQRIQELEQKAAEP